MPFDADRDPSPARRALGAAAHPAGGPAARVGWVLAVCGWLAASPAWGSMPGAQTPARPPARIEQFDAERDIPKADRPAVFEDYVLAFRSIFALGDFAGAAWLAARATRLYPELRRPWNHLAAARVRQAQWGPAIEAARFADRARDDTGPPAPVPEESAAAAAYWEGVALFSTQRYAEALPRLRAAATRDPTWAEAHRAVAECLFVSGGPAAAAPEYERAFALDPGLGSTRDLSYFAEARAAAGDLEGGIAAVQEALQRAPYEPGLHAKLADLYRRGKRPVDAYYELLYELMLHGPRGRFASPALSLQSELVQAAKQTRDERSSQEIILVAGSLRSVQNDEFHDALHKLQFAMRDARGLSPVPQFLFGDTEARAGLHANARASLQAVVDAHPDFVPAWFRLSEVETTLGDPQAAGKALQRVRDAFPGYWKLHEKPAAE